PERSPERGSWPQALNLQLHLSESLRYGENPHQQAALYRDPQAATTGLLSNYIQLQGKALSYNNIADADAAWECVRSFEQSACVMVKHASPCGVALGARPSRAYQRALKTVPTSGFGGILSFNRTVESSTVEELLKRFVEVLLAPDYSDEARAL